LAKLGVLSESNGDFQKLAKNYEEVDERDINVVSPSSGSNTLNNSDDKNSFLHSDPERKRAEDELHE